jgi:hypothetical protein
MVSGPALNVAMRHNSATIDCIWVTLTA